MAKFLTNRPINSFLFSSLILTCSALGGCGSEQESNNFIKNQETPNDPQYQGSVIGGVMSYDDCYDVALQALPPSSSGRKTCSGFRVYPGVFMTAAHCVTDTRPMQNPPPSKWNTRDVSFTLNPSEKGRATSNQITSLQIIVPPLVSNYSNAQWAGKPTGMMIGTDLAIVITNDTQAVWDKYANTSSNPPFNPPAVGDVAYIAGYGFGIWNSQGDFTDSGKRRYGPVTIQSINDWLVSFTATNWGYGVAGDSGSPFYASNGGQDYRKIVSLMSSWEQDRYNNNMYWNYGPNLATVGGSSNYEWLNANIQYAKQAINCLANAYNNATGSCLPN